MENKDKIRGIQDALFGGRLFGSRRDAEAERIAEGVRSGRIENMSTYDVHDASDDEKAVEAQANTPEEQPSEEERIAAARDALFSGKAFKEKKD